MATQNLSFVSSGPYTIVIINFCEVRNQNKGDESSQFSQDSHSCSIDNFKSWKTPQSRHTSMIGYPNQTIINRGYHVRQHNAIQKAMMFKTNVTILTLKLTRSLCDRSTSMTVPKFLPFRVHSLYALLFEKKTHIIIIF